MAQKKRPVRAKYLSKMASATVAQKRIDDINEEIKIWLEKGRRTASSQRTTRYMA